MDNMMMQMMQMMMQQNQMMTQMMMQQMTSMGQNLPNSSFSPVMASNAAVVNPDMGESAEVQSLKAEIDRLKSELAAANSQISSLKSQIQNQASSSTPTISQSFSNPSFKTIKDGDSQIEGQKTLEDEILYNERHGQIGHENYKKIMEQLSPEERERVRAATFLDSTGVFDVDLKAVKEETSFMDAFYELYPHERLDFGPGNDEVNELGF